MLTDKEMTLCASISRYIGEYPIFRMPARYRPISLFHLEIYLYPFPRNVLAIAFYVRFKQIAAFISSPLSFRRNNRDLFLPLQNADATRKLLKRRYSE